MNHDDTYIERLRAEIARREQRKRFFDAAECPQWGRDTVSREDNEKCLAHAYGRLACVVGDKS